MNLSNRQREAFLLAVLIIIVSLGLCIVMALLGARSCTENAKAEPNRIELYECGKATGLHDNKPGYHIVLKARFVQYEDGSGALMCGHETMVIVHVPW